MKERYQQLKELFQSALECAANERMEFLDKACNGDASLRAELEELIAAHKQEGYLDAPTPASNGALTDRPDETMEGRRIGPYKILRELGHGGMGAVYLAVRDDDQFKKRVAIKLIRRGMDTDSIIRRFRHERQVLAALDHPNIARLLDGGTTADGLPYLVLEYVEGQPFGEYCDRHQLTTVERLQIFRQVAAAVHYAHQNLVVHRDLKPGNILVTPDGTPKLLDFGIAKILNPEISGQTIDPTLTAMKLMTPGYASPEQIRGETITTASDVYSLGVILYELLTGHRPYHVSSHAAHEIARIVCEEEPPKPSSAVTRIEIIPNRDENEKVTITPEQVARARNEQPEKLRRRLAGDLDSIVLMALRKEPKRRYASVEQFSEDLRRYLDGLPVVASRDTFAYRSTKFMRRHKTGVAATMLAALSLITGTGIAVWQARLAARQRDEARLEKAKAESINSFLQELLSFSSPQLYLPNAQKDHEVTIKDVLDATGPLIESELADQPEVKASIQRTIGDSYRGLGQLELAESYIRQALEGDLKLYGENHSETVKSMAALASLMSAGKGNKGDSASPEALYQKLIPIYRKQHQEGRVDTNGFVTVLNDYSIWVRFRGKLKEAEALLREALELAANLPNKDRGQRAVIKLNLALVRADQGDLAEAVQMNRAAIGEYRQIPGRELPEFGITLASLGDELTTLNQLAEADAVLREAETSLRKLVSETHPFISTVLCFQANLLYRKGDYTNAEKTVRKSIELFHRAGAEAHQHYATALTTLGLILNRTGRTVEAESTLREALNVRTRFFPTGHYKTALTRGALGECLTTQKRYAEAEEPLLTSFQDLKSTQGEQNPRTAEALQRLAALYEAWSKPDQAARYRKLLP